MENSHSDFVLKDKNGEEHGFEMLDLVEREENDYLVLLDENGEEHTFEMLSLVERKGTEYLVLLPIEDDSAPPKVVVLAVADSEETDIPITEYKTVYYTFYDVDPSHTDYGDVLRMGPDEIEAFLKSEDSGDCDEGILASLKALSRWNREAKAGIPGNDPMLWGIIIQNSPYTKRAVAESHEKPSMPTERQRELERLSERILSGAIVVDDLSLDELCEVGSLLRDRRKALEKHSHRESRERIQHFFGGAAVDTLCQALSRFRSRLQ